MTKEQIDGIKERLSGWNRGKDEMDIFYKVKIDARELIAEVERLTRESDAMMKELYRARMCYTCTYSYGGFEETCIACKLTGNYGKWQWRGVKEVGK